MDEITTAYGRCFENSGGVREHQLRCWDSFSSRIFTNNGVSPVDFETMDRSWNLTVPSAFFYAKVAFMFVVVLFYFVYIIASQICADNKGTTVYKNRVRGPPASKKKSGKRHLVLERSIIRAHSLLCAWMMLGIFLGFCAWFDRKIFEKQYFREIYSDVGESLMVSRGNHSNSRCLDIRDVFAGIESISIPSARYSNETAHDVAHLTDMLNTLTCARVYAWCDGDERCYLEYSPMITNISIQNVSGVLECILDYDYGSLRVFSAFTARILEKMSDLKLYCFALPILSVISWYERTFADVTTRHHHSKHRNRRLIYNAYLLALLGCIYFGLGVWDSSMNYSYAHQFADASKVKAFGEVVFDSCYPKRNDVVDDARQAYESEYFKNYVFRWRSVIVSACCIGWALLDIVIERIYDRWIITKMRDSEPTSKALEL